MRVVVTGGSGQLGTCLLKRLVADRKVKRIVCIDLKPPCVPSPKIDWQLADVRDPGVERHLDGADVLIHLAFIVVSGAPEEVRRAVNIDGSKRLFKGAAAAGVQTILYASSVASYGLVPGHPKPIVETTPRRQGAQLPYSREKVEVEDFLDGFEARHPQVRIVRLRPGILYGSRIEHGGLADTLRRGRVFDLGPDAVMPVVWDEDVAAAFQLALHNDVRGGFNLVADEPLNAEGLAAAGDYKLINMRFLPPLYRAIHPLLSKYRPNLPDPAWLGEVGADYVFAAGKAQAELGWKPQCKTTADVMKRVSSELPRKLDRRIALFLRMLSFGAKRLRPEDLPEEHRRVKLALHLELTGKEGGDVTLDIDKGMLTIAPGVPRPLDAVITLSTRTFLDLLTGKETLATAQFTGKVRLRGEPAGSMILGTMITRFRRATEVDGLAAWPAQKLSAWFARGAPA